MDARSQARLQLVSQLPSCNKLLHSLAFRTFLRTLPAGRLLTDDCPATWQVHSDLVDTPHGAIFCLGCAVARHKVRCIDATDAGVELDGGALLVGRS